MSSFTDIVLNGRGLMCLSDNLGAKQIGRDESVSYKSPINFQVTPKIVHQVAKVIEEYNYFTIMHKKGSSSRYLLLYQDLLLLPWSQTTARTIKPTLVASLACYSSNFSDLKHGTKWIKKKPTGCFHLTKRALTKKTPAWFALSTHTTHNLPGQHSIFWDIILQAFLIGHFIKSYDMMPCFPIHNLGFLSQSRQYFLLKASFKL